MLPDTLESKITPKGKFIGNYLFIKKLGNMDYGEIWKVFNVKKEKFFAIKKLDKFKVDNNEFIEKLLMSEVVIMKSLKHPNILYMHDFFESKNNYYLVVDFCEQGSLMKLLDKKKERRFAEKDAQFFLQQILNAFMVLRKNKILHRSINLSNIFLNKSVVKIGEFGYAKQGFDISQTKIGDMETIAYEILINFDSDNEEASYNHKADLWSIGVIYYQMLQGHPPFQGLSIEQLTANIKLKVQDLEFPHEVSEQSKNLIKKMLVLNPDERIDWHDVLQHPLFSKEDMITQTEIKEERNKNIKESEKVEPFMSFTDIMKFESRLQKRKSLEEVVIENGIIFEHESKIQKDQAEKILKFAEKFLFN